MILDKRYISKFIKQLHLEKTGVEASPELIANWEQLSQDEINANLITLFQRWDMTEVDMHRAIEKFNKQNTTTSSNVAQSVRANPAPKSSVKNTSYPSPKKSTHPIVWLLILAIAGAVAFFAYQYIVYYSLSKVYAITDNIAIRNNEGKSVGRMDLYENKKLGSFAQLRTLSNDIHYLRHENDTKEYPSRKVLMDSTGFFDFLFHKTENTYYVNTSYVVNNKQEFDLYQKSFKELNTVPADNEKLNAIHRKIIVGSMARVSNLKNSYLISNSAGLSKGLINATNPFLIQEIRPAQHYVILASLNDGNFYRFEGDVKLNEYMKPEPVRIIQSSGQPQLVGSFRFQKNKDVWRLFDVQQKKATYYEAIKDAMGKYAAFELNEPAAPPPVDTNTIYTLDDF